MPVWQRIAVGKSAGLMIEVTCPESDPSYWQLEVHTAIAHVCLALPDHTAVHQLLRFIEKTHRVRFEVRPETDVGTFCGRHVRFVRNDEDDRYYATLGPPESGGVWPEESVFLWLDPEQIDVVVECLRQLVRALDACEEQP